MTPWQRLVHNNHTWEAVDQLLDKGMCDGDVFPTLQYIAALPELHYQLIEESPEARVKRRRALANELLKMAHKVEEDPEAKHFRYVDYDNLKKVTEGGRERVQMAYFTLVEALRDAAEGIQGTEGLRDINNEHLSGKWTTRITRKEYIQREVLAVLDERIIESILVRDPHQKKPDAPRTAALLLSNVILGPDEQVTEDQMKKVPRPELDTEAFKKILPQQNASKLEKSERIKQLIKANPAACMKW